MLRTTRLAATCFLTAWCVALAAPRAVAQQVDRLIGPPIEVAPEDFEVTGELGGFRARLHAEQLEPGIQVVRVRI